MDSGAVSPLDRSHLGQLELPAVNTEALSVMTEHAFRKETGR